jgi:hypothetical protein
MRRTRSVEHGAMVNADEDRLSIGGALLQPQERPPAGGARVTGLHARRAVQAHHLRRVPPLLYADCSR